MDNVIQTRAFEKVVMRKKGFSCSVLHGSRGMGTGQRQGVQGNGSKTATALQLELPLGSAPGVLCCDQTLAVGLEQSPFLQEDSQRDRLEQGPGSLGTARWCFLG